MSSNIIGPFPKKSVAPSEMNEKEIGNLDDIEAPVDMICRKDIDHFKKRIAPRNINSRVILKDQSAC